MNQTNQTIVKKVLKWPSPTSFLFVVSGLCLCFAGLFPVYQTAILVGAGWVFGISAAAKALIVICQIDNN